MSLQLFALKKLTTRLSSHFCTNRFHFHPLNKIQECLMKVLEDKEPPLNAPLAAKYRRSFAFPSMNERTPVILTKIIDYLARDKKNLIQKFGENVEEELKTVIGEISQLKNHLQTAKCFQKFTSGSQGSDLWNAELESRKAKSDPLNYYESDWLFAECYLYRRINEFFATKQLLSKLDPFSYQKTVVLEQSVASLQPHLKRLHEKKTMEKDCLMTDDEKQSELAHMIKCSLWANRMDLSLSGGSTDVSIDVLEQVRNWDENILVNDSHYVTEILLQGSSPEVVDFVTDNGGVEVLHDMILADFILSRCGVRKIQFRLKPMPWYVSDVTPSDFHTTVNSLLNSNDDHLQYFGKRWQNFIDSGAWSLSSEDFWCLGLSYSEMPRVDPNLHKDLKASPLVIFKGDLNYRKLVQDRNWDTTTPFRLALGQFSDVTLLALRTCKADTIAGLKPDQAELTASKSSDWLVSGEYGLIQFNKGNCGAQ